MTILGTAHFTKRSLLEAYKAVRELEPTDLALELDIQRFQYLNQRCAKCPTRQTCAGQCEFVGAADALGNCDANIWLIDMSEEEIADRIHQLLPPYRMWPFSLLRFPFRHQTDDEVQLWEKGYKDEVLHRHERRLKTLRLKAPHIWQVLIDERNALMAARLAWVSSKNLDKGKNPSILTFVGAAHVSGIKDLLQHPLQIRNHLRKFNLSFTDPTLIRRVAVQVH